MAQVLLAKKAVWGGIKWLEFHPDGSLTTPWGKGRWGDAATAAKPSAIFAEFRDDPALRVAIFTGSGERFFSAGWDLGAAADGEAFEADYGEGGFGGFVELPDRKKPVICAVNGMAVGGGFEIALAAEFVIAAVT